MPRLRLADSVTEAVADGAGTVLVTGSHGGLSSSRFAIEARPHVVVFNDAGVGLDRAGVVGLDRLEAAGIAACAVSHLSARIGEARSTLEDGVVSVANPRAQALGLVNGVRLAQWVRRYATES